MHNKRANQKQQGVGIDQPAKNNKGITLIALIITIIVMLILVSVTVRVTLNGNIFGHANKAVIRTEGARVAELLRDELYGEDSDIIHLSDTWLTYLQGKDIVSKDGKNVINVKKLMKKSKSGKGTYEDGDVYYIANEKIYYLDKDKELTEIGIIMLGAGTDPDLLDESYFNYIINEDGDAEIIGLILDRFDCQADLGMYDNVAVRVNKSRIVIPNKLDGKNVVKISFRNSITSVGTWFGWTARGGSSRLEVFGIKEITYPATLKILENENIMFSSVEKINLPEGLEEIGSYAFMFADNVMNITIPSSVKTIGYSPFLGWNTDATVLIEGKASASEFEDSPWAGRWIAYVNFPGVSWNAPDSLHLVYQNAPEEE